MEGAHGELSAGLADALGGHDANGLARLHQFATGQAATVAESAEASLGLTGQRRTHVHALDAQCLDTLGHFLADHLIAANNEFACLGIDQVRGCPAASDALP